MEFCISISQMSMDSDQYFLNYILASNIIKNQPKGFTLEYFMYRIPSSLLWHSLYITSIRFSLIKREVHRVRRRVYVWRKRDYFYSYLSISFYKRFFNYCLILYRFLSSETTNILAVRLEYNGQLRYFSKTTSTE